MDIDHDVTSGVGDERFLSVRQHWILHGTECVSALLARSPQIWRSGGEYINTNDALYPGQNEPCTTMLSVHERREHSTKEYTNLTSFE